MKTRMLIAGSTTLLTGLLLINQACATASDINNLPPAEIRSLAEQAYVFSYPLIMNYATMYKQAIDQHSPTYIGGFGQFRHYGFATSDNKDIVSPNNDTPYSWGWVDLRAEPWVMVMPPVDSNRYYASQWDDIWGFVLDSPGSVLDGQQGGAYLVAPVSWHGTVPKGIKRVIHSESLFAGTLTRTGATGPEELATVQAIQAGYKLMPLHSYLRQPAPKAAPAMQWLPYDPSEEKTPEVFKYVNFMLPYTLPDAQDKVVLENMAKLGIAPGKKWDTSTFSASTRASLQAGIDDAMNAVGERSKHVNSGELFATRKQMGADYLDRMLGVLEGIFGNYASQATYLAWHNDADGQPINTTTASYKLTFKKGETPAAKYFWSITMYTMPERFLVPNALNRYSIGSRSPQLKTNADGSIDIYISQQSPGKSLESNWLPAPNGVPFIVMRVYGPGKSVLNNKYQLPSLVKVK